MDNRRHRDPHDDPIPEQTHQASGRERSRAATWVFNMFNSTQARHADASFRPIISGKYVPAPCTVHPDRAYTRDPEGRGVYEGGAPAPRPTPPKRYSSQRGTANIFEHVAFTHGPVLGTSTLLVTGVVPAAVLPVATGGAVRTVTAGAAALAGAVAGGPAGGAGGLHVRLGHDLAGEVEELAEVGETLVGEGVVVVLPRELGLDEALGREGLHRLDDLEVADGGDVRVGRAVEVLGRDEDTVLEESLVDLREVRQHSAEKRTHQPMSLRCLRLTVRRFCLVMIMAAVFSSESWKEVLVRVRVLERCR